jgi:uncharacterized protein (DUF2461 family)
MAFAGYPEEALSFFEAVMRDTSWATVSARLELHARAVREPTIALCEELEEEFGEIKVFRLHRSPSLWTHQSAYASVADTIAYGLSLSLEGLSVEGGWLYSSPDQVERYRAAVYRDLPGEELRRTLEGLRAFELIGETLKAAPRGYEADHPRIDLLRRRSLVAVQDLGRGPWLHTREALERVRTGWRELRPLVEWFSGNVGPRLPKQELR